MRRNLYQKTFFIFWAFFIFCNRALNENKSPYVWSIKDLVWIQKYKIVFLKLLDKNIIVCVCSVMI